MYGIWLLWIILLRYSYFFIFLLVVLIIYWILVINFDELVFFVVCCFLVLGRNDGIFIWKLYFWRNCIEFLKFLLMISMFCFFKKFMKLLVFVFIIWDRMEVLLLWLLVKNGFIIFMMYLFVVVMMKGLIKGWFLCIEYVRCWNL